MREVLIDTDVILDQLLAREPFVDDSSVLLSLCENNEIRGYVTTVICSNLYYILRRISSHQKVIATLKDLLSFLDVLEMDQQVVTDSLNSEFSDFEDALQNFSAEHKPTINIIVTRNHKDYATSDLAVMSPQEFLGSLN